MPDGGIYKKVPRPESLEAVRRTLGQHSAVRDFEEMTSQFYKIERYRRSAISLHVTNIYIVGLADVQEILAEHPSVNCILTVSAWNSYTPQAKEYSRGIGVGLFRFYEMMGSLHYDGDAFLNYIAPRDREE